MKNKDSQDQIPVSFLGYFIVLLAALFYAYEYLLRIEPGLMVHYIMHVFAINASVFSVMVAMYYYAYTPLQLVVGVLTDRFGPRRILILALAICLLGIFLFANESNFYLICFARLLIGCGSAFAFIGSLKLASVWLPANRFALFAGFCTSLGMLGAIFGEISITWAIQKAGVNSVLNWSFWAGILLFLLFVIFLKNKPANLKAPVLPIQSKMTFGYVFIELTKLMKIPSLWIVGLMGAVLFLSLSAIGELWGVAFFKSFYHINHLEAAKLNSMIFLGWLIGAPIIGLISDRIRQQFPLMIFGCFISAILGYMIIAIHPNHILTLYIFLFLFGVFSSSEVLVFSYVRDLVSSKLMATAASFMNLLVMCSGLIAQPALGALLDHYWSGSYIGSARYYSYSDYQHALIYVPIAMFFVGVVALLWRLFFNEKPNER